MKYQRNGDVEENGGALRSVRVHGFQYGCVVVVVVELDENVHSFLYPTADR